MISTTLLAATLLLQPSIATPDPWLAEDKLRHLFTSFVLTSLSASGARLAGIEPRTSLWLGAGIASGAGVYKEITDASVSRFSFRDIVWDLTGIAGAALILDAAR